MFLGNFVLFNNWMVIGAYKVDIIFVVASLVTLLLYFGQCQHISLQHLARRGF